MVENYKQKSRCVYAQRLVLSCLVILFAAAACGKCGQGQQAQCSRSRLRYIQGHQVAALKADDIDSFFKGVLESGRSSFCYLQNVYTTKNVNEQGLSLALCLADGYLSGKKAAFRVHGGGFAGTIQAFVPTDHVEGFRQLMDSAFGSGACLILRVRRDGAIKVI